MLLGNGEFVLFNLKCSQIRLNSQTILFKILILKMVFKGEFSLKRTSLHLLKGV